MTRRLDKIAIEFPSVRFYSVNIDDEPQYKTIYNIEYVPCVILTDRGKIVNKITGNSVLMPALRSVFRQLDKRKE